MIKQPDSEAAVVLNLVGKIYEPAATPELWPQFLDAFATTTSSDATMSGFTIPTAEAHGWWKPAPRS